MRRPQPNDIKFDLSNDFIDGEVFEITEYSYGITRKDWICGTDFCDYIQMIGCFEMIDEGEYGEMGDEEFPILVQTSLMVHPKYFGQKYLKEIFQSSGLDEDYPYDVHAALMDAMMYSGGIPVNIESISCPSRKCDVKSKIITTDYGTFRRFASFDDAEKYIKEMYVHNMSVVMGLIGFYLDKYTNRIGTTGWDHVNTMVEGTDLFQPAFDRYKEQCGDDNE